MGKSSLKHFLVHNAPKAVKTSTAVIDMPEVVSTSAEQYAVGEGTSAWQLVSNDVMGKSLHEVVRSKSYDEGQYPELLDIKVRIGEEESPGPIPSPMSPPKGIVDSTAVDLLDKGHSSLLEKMREGDKKIELKNASFIHLLDTGGQPAFQDALPRLLAVPSTFIQVFNAAYDLDKPIPITYRPNDETENILPSSRETGWEMMLRSFSSMQTMSHKSSKELGAFQQQEGQLPQLRIFVVGTFKDKLKGRLKEAVQDINKRLEALEEKPYYQYIERDGAGKLFYLISNVSDEDDERACMNSLRKDLSSTRACLKLKVPVMWFICEQSTRRTSQKFFTLQDFKTFCLKQEFIDDGKNADSQFRALLQLFSLLGFYSFFNLKGVSDEANYVCTDTGMFLKEVSKLLAVQYSRDATSRPMHHFKCYGIISDDEELFEELDINKKMNREWFLNVLEHLGLVARYPAAFGYSCSYFMPIALPQGKKTLPDHSTVAPLCVTFKFDSPNNPLVYTDLPRGVFCQLAVQLSKGPWKPIAKESDRTTVRFNSENFTFELYLTEAPGFICLTPVLMQELEGEEPVAELHKLCKDMYDTFHKSIDSAAEDVLGEQFSQTATPEFGFECDCGRVPHLTSPTSAKAKYVICQFQKRRRSKKEEQIWFSLVSDVKVRGLYIVGFSYIRIRSCTCAPIINWLVIY